MTDRSGSNAGPATCGFGAGDLYIGKLDSNNPNISSWSCSRPVWSSGDGRTTRCVWHAETDEKPCGELADTIQDGDLHGAKLPEINLSSLSWPDTVGLINATLSEANLAGATLSGANMAGATLSGANLPHTDLSGANMQEADLSKIQRNVGDSKTNLVWADLSETNLTGADLSGADLWQANLSGADLRGASLSGADLRGTSLSGADLREADLSGAEPDFFDKIQAVGLSWKLQRANFSEKALWHIYFTQSLQGADFSGANLRKANFSEATLSEANFSEATLLEANFSEATLREVNFSGADLMDFDLSGAYLEANFSGADLQGAKFPEATLREVNFSGADLREANFPEATLLEANFPGADLREANFSGADLREANFSGADLREANFSGENLQRVDLTGAHLEGADFAKAFLEGADFSEADLREANLSKASLEDSNFSEADLREADISDEPIVDLSHDAPDELPSDVNLFQSFRDTDLSWRLRRANLSEETLDYLEVDRPLFDAPEDPEEALGFFEFGPSLRGANFSGADLREANFSKAMLRGGNFSGADLREANFSKAMLRDADLSGANLNDADLSGANLNDADLSGANLNDADLSGANLEDADLSQTDLRGTTLDHAGLYETSLQNVDVNERTSACPPSRWQLDADKSAEIGVFGWPLLRRFRAFHRSASDPRVLRSAEQQYRRIERLYRENDLRPNRRLAVAEKHARRKQALAKGDMPGWLAGALSRWVLGYGLLIWPIVLVMTFVIIACALVYPVYGFNDGTLAKGATATGTVAYETLPPTLSVETARTFARSLYFSTVTFSTLGYGDIFPTGGARALATLESFVGALSIAYLVSVLSRRVIR